MLILQKRKYLKVMIMRKTYFTLKEIYQQPSVWKKLWKLIDNQADDLKMFLKDLSEYEVIFTGAGSSYFVGEIVAPIFQEDTSVSCKAVSSTEIVTHTKNYINANKKTLLVSFARSGNSPESLAAIEFVNSYSKNIKHLIITCNSNGKLAKIPKNDNIYTIILPEETNDKSLAMTSSVTSMALIAILIGRLDKIDEQKNKIQQLSDSVDDFLKKNDTLLKNISEIPYDRAVFLGSGPRLGVAREAHLKLQELTDGEIISKFDSFLGFRHGPKVVLNNNTLVVYFFSNNENVRLYEYDLVKSVYQSQNPKLSIGIFNKPISDEIDNLLDVNFIFDYNNYQLDDAYLSIAGLTTIQLLATYKSEFLGYNPDSPSKSGAIHRVVKGVKIYK